VDDVIYEQPLTHSQRKETAEEEGGIAINSGHLVP
jgi:hypothetical protein